MDENALANARVRKADGEAQLKALNMAQYTRETTKLLRELEEQRDACHVALSALNSLADTRAKRELKREEMVQKNEAVDALSVVLRSLSVTRSFAERAFEWTESRRIHQPTSNTSRSSLRGRRWRAK